MGDLVFGLKSAIAIVNGKEIDLAANMLRIVSPDTDSDRIREPFGRVAERVIGATITFRLSDDAATFLHNLIVGAQMTYRLREVHRNLGRYTRWPYTN